MVHLMYGDRFLERNVGERAWHALGTTFAVDDYITATDGFTRAGLDYRVAKLPALTRLPDDLGGDVIKIPDRFHLYRLPQTFNGTDYPLQRLSEQLVSENYTPLDNLDIAAALDNLATVWPLETVGALRDGAVIFVTFDGGEFAIKGDEHKMYFLVTDGKDGTRAMRIALTPVRVVCNNTLTLGLAQANFIVDIPHRPSAYRDLDFWATIVPQLNDSAEKTREALELLANTKATKPMVAAVIDATFPLPKRGAKASISDLAPITITPVHQDMIDREISGQTYMAERSKRFRAMAWECYDVFNQENPNTAQTLFAAAQAANETAVWRKGYKDVGEAVVFGERATESARAFKKAYALATQGSRALD